MAPLQSTFNLSQSNVFSIHAVRCRDVREAKSMPRKPEVTKQTRTRLDLLGAVIDQAHFRCSFHDLTLRSARPVSFTSLYSATERESCLLYLTQSRHMRSSRLSQQEAGPILCFRAQQIIAFRSLAEPVSESFAVMANHEQLSSRYR